MNKYLKIIALTFMSILSLSLISCGDDDGDGGVSVNAEQLYGTWIGVSQTYNSKESPYVKGRSITFNEDGTGTVSDKNLFEDQIIGTFTWSIAGSKLKITDSTNDTGYWTITAISSSTLQLTWKASDDTEVTTFSKK